MSEGIELTDFERGPITIPGGMPREHHIKVIARDPFQKRSLAFKVIAVTPKRPNASPGLHRR
jgi:hypothetical protein